MACRIATLLTVSHIVGQILGVLRATSSPEGCEDGFLYHGDYCYRTEVAKTDFDVARGTCISFRSTLSSLWKPAEIEFVSAELQKLHVPAAWIGLVPTKSNRWMWSDGSFFDLANKDTPKSNPDLCATLTSDGVIHYVTCNTLSQGFVCKRPLDRLYVPTNVRITSSDIDIPDKDESLTVFERLWPPTLSLVAIEKSVSSARLATIDVARETDCAYRCYTVDDCRAFIVTCKTLRKCNIFSCTLLSNIVHA